MTDYTTVTSDLPMTRTGAIKLYGAQAFAGMHRAGRLAAETLDMLVPHMVPGTTTAEAQRIAKLEQEVRELRRANHILKTSAAFFAAELDHPTNR